MLSAWITQLNERQPLSETQVQEAVAQLVDEQVEAEVKAAFLAALARKGETAAEIAGFARALREKSLPVPLDPVARAGVVLDVVGTGGDRLGTFNISTCAAIVAAAAGVRVAKHGNRAVTSKTGSADVIEALGMPLELTPEEAATRLRERGFVFLFAPRFHPAFRHIAPARKLCAARGQRTIFNLLGPLLNPARPSALLVGVPQPDLCEKMAAALRALEVRRAMVVCGHAHADPTVPPQYLDEFSTLGETTVVEFYHARGLNASAFHPKHLPVGPATLAALSGGDRLDNARIVHQVLGGEDRGPRRDAVLLNAAAALLVADRVRSLTEGWESAAALIDGGQAAAKLAELIA